MKHYVDIEVLREKDEDLGGGISKKSNALAFRTGDIISITEKIDGSNASMEYDIETGTLLAYSRKQPLTFSNTLDGFWNFVQGLNAEDYKDVSNLVIFGEWNRKNKITYAPEFVHKWYVYSIYDKEKEVWLDQDFVKNFCKNHDLIYVHELYYGPFISWEHCRTFCNSPAYGERQEGIVVRNITSLARGDKWPHILKIVNADFKESMKTRVKVVDPEKEQAKADALEMLKGIITQRRVEKMLFSLRDDGIIPSEFTPDDMKIVAKHLPKRVYDDCLKEEPEILNACGEYAGKLSSGLTMQIARNILLDV